MPDPSPEPVQKEHSDPGLQIPDCRILEKLGQGGMGVVYLARQLTHDRLVAVKIIRKDRLAHADAVRRFRREAQAASRLAHPNVVLIHNSHHEGENHSLIMEYVPGRTLQNLVQFDGPLAANDASELMYQAALGLQHITDQGLVHRDIKPSNLMIGEAGGDVGRPRRHLKILDMGVARIFQLGDESPLESLSTLTQPGAVIGTADFIAPEQLEDARTTDCRADLYSLGCSFYYALVGQVPFPGGSLIQKLDRQRWQNPIGVHQLRPDVPRVVSDIIRRLMCKKPEERFQSPAELAEDLRIVRSGGRVAYTETKPVQELRRFAGPQRAIWSIAVSPDGKTAVSGGKDGALRLWNLADGKEMGRFSSRSGEVRCVAYSASGRQVLSAAGVSLRVWDVDSGGEVARLMGHTDTIRAGSFCAHDRKIITCSDDRTARVWDAGTGCELVRFARHRGGVNDLAVTGDGCVFSGGRGRHLRLWRIDNGQERLSLTTSSGQVLAVAVAPNGRYALSGHFDTILRLWDLTDGREVRRLDGHKQMITAVAFTSDGRHLISAGKDQTLRIWESDSGAEVYSFTAHESGITAVCVGPAEPVLLTADESGTIKLWQLPGS